MTWIKTDRFHASLEFANSAVLRAEVYEVAYTDESGPSLGDVPRAVASMDVKWDGCSNLTTSPAGCMWHGCSRADLVAFQEILLSVFDQARAMFIEQGNWGGGA